MRSRRPARNDRRGPIEWPASRPHRQRSRRRGRPARFPAMSRAHSNTRRYGPVPNFPLRSTRSSRASPKRWQHRRTRRTRRRAIHRAPSTQLATETRARIVTRLPIGTSTLTSDPSAVGDISPPSNLTVCDQSPEVIRLSADNESSRMDCTLGAQPRSHGHTDDRCDKSGSAAPFCRGERTLCFHLGCRANASHSGQCICGTKNGVW